MPLAGVRITHFQHNVVVPLFGHVDVIEAQFRVAALLRKRDDGEHATVTEATVAQRMVSFLFIDLGPRRVQ